MLDRMHALASGKRDIGGGHVVLEIDESLAAAGGRDGPRGRRTLRAFGQGWRLGRIETKLAGEGGARLRSPGDAAFEVEPAGRRADGTLRLRRPTGNECLQPVAPAQRPAGLAEEMHRRVPAAAHGNQVAGDTPHAPLRLDLDAGYGAAPEGSQGNRAAQHGQAVRVRHAVRAQIDKRGDLAAVPGELAGGGIDGVVIGEKDGAAARQHGIAVDEGGDGARQHDARPVIAGKDQRALMRAGRQHHTAGADMPYALARPAGAFRRRKAFRQPLGQRNEIMVVIAEGRGAGQQQRRCAGQHPPGPCRAVFGPDALGTVQQRAAEIRALVRQHDARAGRRARMGSRDARRAAADHEDVAMGVAVLIDLGVRFARCARQARHAPDYGRVDAVPPGRRPHEGLVIEAGHEQPGHEPRGRAQIEPQRRPAVDALGGEPVVKLDFGGAQVGLRERTRLQQDERVRLLRPGRHHPARPVVFEAAAEESHAVREQGRRERVAGMAGVAPAVETECEGARPVDPAAGRQAARPCHAAVSGWSGRGAPMG